MFLSFSFYELSLQIEIVHKEIEVLKTIKNQIQNNKKLPCDNSMLLNIYQEQEQVVDKMLVHFNDKYKMLNSVLDTVKTLKKEVATKIEELSFANKKSFKM